MKIQTLKVQAPKNIRNEVYRMALDFINKREYSELYGITYKCGLCVMLPTIAFEQHYLSDLPNGQGWCFVDAEIAFPELSDWLHKYYDHTYQGDIIDARKTALLKMIELTDEQPEEMSIPKSL